MTEPLPTDTAKTPHEEALRAELRLLAYEVEKLRKSLAAALEVQQQAEDKLAALLAPYPTGTVVEERYQRGYYRAASHEATRYWRLEKAGFRYGTTIEYLSYEAVFVKKDGTLGGKRQRIAATTLLAGRPSPSASTTWRVLTEEVPECPGGVAAYCC